jgi:protein O-GlcNAcase/histone acetyltransferase
LCILNCNRYFGAFVTLSPELCFVVEDDNSVVGFAAAAANAKELLRRIRVAWIPEMKAKYPLLFDWNQSDTNGIAPPLKVKQIKTKRAF